MNIKTITKKESFILGTGAASMIFIAVIILIVFSPTKFISISEEDGLIETTSALAFLVASIFFLLSIFRSKSIRSAKNIYLASIFTICWGLFSLLCFGEEISWGQRLFGFELEQENRVENYHVIEGVFQNIQNETNLHNMGFVEQIGNRIIIIAIQLIAGLILPLLAFSDKIKSFFNKIYFPTPPIYYSLFILGGIALIASKLIFDPALVNGVYLYDRINEFSEMMMAIGFSLFALHSFVFPDTVFK